MTPFRLDDWTVYPDRNLISRGREQRTLEPRQMDLLVRLARAGGETVPKDALIRDVWSDLAVVDHVIAKTVSALRGALGESARRPRVIRTIPRRGYRLGCEVRPLDEVAGPGASAWPRRRWRAPAQLTAAGAAGAAIAFAASWILLVPTVPPSPEDVKIQVRIHTNAPVDLDYEFDLVRDGR